ncbi:MAG: YraN family protein [Proteobacteria bacterium]|nr:YraN family protein [Pseudomonadota bacterium]
MNHPLFKLKIKKSQTTTKEKGDLYERCAVAYCRKKGFKILGKNLRINRGEIDCLAWDENKNTLIIIEVRGRSSEKYLPSRFISPQKVERLKTLAMSLVQQKRCSVRIYLLEVIGTLPEAHLQWGLSYFPEKLGLKIRDYEILESQK